MCERYTLTVSKDVLSKRFNIEVSDRYHPRYNAAPTQILPLIIPGSKGLSFFYWGQIPERAKNRSISAKLLHTDGESVAEKPQSMRSLMERRCLIPADGFYAWKRISKKGRVAHRIVFGDNEIVSFGGIWEEFEDDNGEVAHTFKILTIPSNATLTPMDSRMPLILDRNSEKIWINTASSEQELTELMKPYPESGMRSYSVSPKIDDIRNDSPLLIQPFAPADQFGNYSLFD